MTLGRCAGFDAMERPVGIGTGRSPDKVALALMASACARFRLQRMKAMAGYGRAAVGRFPFPHRTVAQLRRDELVRLSPAERSRRFWAEP